MHCINNLPFANVFGLKVTFMKNENLKQTIMKSVPLNEPRNDHFHYTFISIFVIILSYSYFSITRNNLSVLYYLILALFKYRGAPGAVVHQKCKQVLH